MKYAIFNIEIKCADYEFNSYGLHEMPNEVNISEFAEEYLSTFYGNYEYNEAGEIIEIPGEKSEGDEGYYFNGGELYCSLVSAQEITKREYDVMKKYI